MTSGSARSFTGSRVRPGRLAFLAVALLAVVPSTADSQALQIQSLRFPPTSVVGPWVTYRVQTQFRAITPREYTQRVAIVGRGTHRGREGFWVELKTEGLPSGNRIERGFFIVVGVKDQQPREGEMAELPPDSLPPPMPPGVNLVRYQVFTSGGKLYEYPVGGGAEPRVNGDVSTMELFEYDSSTPPATPFESDAASFRPSSRGRTVPARTIGPYPAIQPTSSVRSSPRLFGGTRPCRLQASRARCSRSRWSGPQRRRGTARPRRSPAPERLDGRPQGGWADRLRTARVPPRRRSSRRLSSR
jgi:hypothetical protein